VCDLRFCVASLSRFLAWSPACVCSVSLVLVCPPFSPPVPSVYPPPRPLLSSSVLFCPPFPLFTSPPPACSCSFVFCYPPSAGRSTSVPGCLEFSERSLLLSCLVICSRHPVGDLGGPLHPSTLLQSTSLHLPPPTTTAPEVTWRLRNKLGVEWNRSVHFRSDTPVDRGSPDVAHEASRSSGDRNGTGAAIRPGFGIGLCFWMPGWYVRAADVLGGRCGTEE
jgi:hypothetical protein